MFRPLTSILLGVAALLVTAGLLVTSVPVTRAGGVPALAVVDASPCPYENLVILEADPAGVT